MDKETSLQKMRDKMGARKLNPIEASSAAQIMEDLETSAAINDRDLISYLDVADKTIRNWRTSKPDSNSSKLTRLFRLKEVVDAALESSLSKPMIRQLLVAPLDAKDENQHSIIDMIKSEPDPKFFPQVISMLLETFKNRQSSSGHFVLKNEDFDLLIRDLQSDRSPTEALKQTRERFQQLRKERK